MNNKVRLFCPACIGLSKSPLLIEKNTLKCQRPGCECVYEFYLGIPVLLTKSGDALRLLKRVNMKRDPSCETIY